jgi:type I restriction enzyme S subunit
MRDEEGLLPPGWGQARLGDLVIDKAGVTDGPFGSNLKTEHYTDSGPRVVRLQNIGDCVFLDGHAHISEEHYATLTKHDVRAGDVLIASLGETLPRACMAPECLGDAIVKADCLRVRPAPGIDSHFVMYMLNSPQVRSQVSRAIKGVGRPRINLSDVRDIVIPLPPTAEQRRIVAALERRLSHLDQAVKVFGLSCLKLDLLHQAVLDGAARGTLLRLDHSSWIEVETGAVAEVRGGIQKQPKRAPKQNKAPFLRVANVGRGRLDLAEVHEIELFNDELRTYALREGDLLVVEGNGSVDQIGRAAMWDDSIPDCVHQNHLIRVRPGDRLDPEFLALVWNAPSTIEQLKAVASSTSGLHTLSNSKVKAVKLRLPDLRTQRDLVAEAERRLSTIEAVRASLAASQVRARHLRRSLLAAAHSGRLVPQDPSDESADVLLARIKEKRATTEAANGKAPRRRAARKKGEVPA